MKTKAKQAVFQYQKSVVNALKEVEDALIAVQKSSEQRAAQERQVAALQSALRLAHQWYQGGASELSRRAHQSAKSVQC